jgi:flagellar assembly protein FliH
MTTLIRQSSDANQPIAWKPGEASSPPAPQRDPLIVALEQEVEELRADLKQAQDTITKAAEDARAQGRKDAEAAFTRDEAKGLALLEGAIETAASEAKAKIAKLDALALLLCETALENAFDRSGDFRDLLTRAIAKQMNGLRREMVLAVHVSPRDFPDEAALGRLQEKLGPNALAIERDDALEAGACRIELRLGHIEIALPLYWRELKAKLRGAATEAAP